MKRPILVLGASGFVGRHLCRMLAASDWAVPIAASRRTEPSREADAHGTPRLRLDATSQDQVASALPGVAGVVNCIAGDPRTIVDSARSIFAAVSSRSEPPAVVHISSMAVYGAAVGDLTETAPPKLPLSPYGQAKLDAEALAGACATAAILRPGIVYGPESAQWSTRIAELLFARRLGDLGNGGDGYCNLVYVADLCEAIVRCLREPGVRGRAYNLSMSNPPTWNEYFTLYAKRLGAVPVRRIGPRRLRIETTVLAPPLKIAEIAVGRIAPRLLARVPKAIPPSLRRTFAQEIRLAVTAAEHDLGMRWTPLETGLAETAAWYRRSTGRSPPPVTGSPA